MASWRGWNGCGHTAPVLPCRCRIRRQRDVFLGAGVDRRDRGAGVIGDAAGDDRYVNVFGLQPHYQIADVEGDIDQQQIGALAAAQHAHRLFVVLGVGNGSAIVHGDLGGGRKLALQCTNDEKPHGNLLFVCSRPWSAVSSKVPQVRSALMISVMVTPSLSSTRTTSPRSEEHTSELQSPDHLVCRLLLEKKKKTN